MACCALNPRANVWRVVELYMRRRLETVHALPRNVLTPRLIGRELFYFRFIFGNYLVASHAEIDAGNPGIRALVHPNVTIRALHAIREMNFVRVSNWLDRHGARPEKFLHCVEGRAVGRCENPGILILRRRLRGLRRSLGRQRPLQKSPRSYQYPQNERNPTPRIQVERKPWQITLLWTCRMNLSTRLFATMSATRHTTCRPPPCKPKSQGGFEWFAAASRRQLLQ
jgi:hypothetical protein